MDDKKILQVNVPNFISISIMLVVGVFIYAAIRKGLLAKAGSSGAAVVAG